MLEPLPTLRPPRPSGSAFGMNLPAGAAFGWLRAGWADLWSNPWPSLAYGLALVFVSWLVLFLLDIWGILYLALPAISGFLIIGPFIAIGLYVKSSGRAQGERVGLDDMISVRPASGAQLAYAGLLLCLLVLFWLRAADLLYALFFGLGPFPGAADALANVMTSPKGWALIITGSFVGGLFAAFAFAISVFSVPMLVFTERDALTAMGTSFAMTTENLRPMLVWGAIVTAGLALSVLTGLVGLIIVFPVLGHGTWHVWRAIGAGRVGQAPGEGVRS